jgi:uncharacterized membrane protein required for colicin V production
LGIVGAMRGWVKEILAGFSIVLGLFVINILETYIPYVSGAITSASPATHFWIRALVLLALTFFGYQSPGLPQFANKTKGERLQDRMLGLILGMINGYLIAGSLWYFMHQAQYPFKEITAPNLKDIQLTALINNLPPVFLKPPALYIAIAIAFIFVVVVFI